MKKYLFVAFACLLLVACQVEFKMNGASIDYTKIKTITISDFPNKAPLVYTPLSQNFNETLRDVFSRQTRLSLVPRNGDLQIEGEIIGYTLTPMSIQSDAYAAETRLTVTIKVRFTNNKDHHQDSETTLSAYQNFSSTKMITDVQDQLLTEIIKELTDDIYNKTVANW
jgi:outer membrane lipopolysaccharide assembly protein LptE/RlpB